jgi:hypothetical protein
VQITGGHTYCGQRCAQVVGERRQQRRLGLRRAPFRLPPLLEKEIRPIAIATILPSVSASPVRSAGRRSPIRPAPALASTISRTGCRVAPHP